MSDRERLLAAFDSGELVRPSPDRLNVVDLANALASIGGAPNVPCSPGVSAIVDLIGPADHVVVVMVDGLGLNVVDAETRRELPRGPRSGRAHHRLPVVDADRAHVLRHGALAKRPRVPSWHLYLDEIDDIATIIHFTRRGDDEDLGSLGITPEQAYPAPPTTARMAWSIFGVVPEEIADSPYSSYCRGHSPTTDTRGSKTRRGRC